MNLMPLYKIQENVDFVISENLNIDINQKEFVNKRIHAFKVELGEFSNETGWFKYWKQSHVKDKDRTLDELADCIAFLLSIGMSRDYHKQIKKIYPGEWVKVPVENLFNYLFKTEFRFIDEWKNAFEQLIQIGIKLGFSLDDIEIAYYKKSGENIERQRVKY